MASGPDDELPPSNPIGAHVPTSGGLAKTALAYVRAVDAEAVQVFVTNPRGWAPSLGDPLQDVTFRDATEGHLPVFVHASFLINLASSNPAIAERSIGSLTHTVRRAGSIGARGVVIHTGSAVTADRHDQALIQTRELLMPLLDSLTTSDPEVLLEPTAGQGQSICSTLDELDGYLHALGHHPRLGLCVDTCHMFAAGHDLAIEGGMHDFLDHLEKVRVGVPVRLVHANDSMDVVGARKDRHQSIGAGHLGIAPFRALLDHPAMSGVPLVVETPGKENEHARDIALLKSLR